MKKFNLWTRRHPVSLAVYIHGQSITPHGFPADVEALRPNALRIFK